MTGRDDDEPRVLSTRHQPKGASVLDQVEGYWRSLIRDGGPPARSAVDSTRIEAALPHAFILERVAPGVARLRFAGQTLSSHLGAEARGMPLSSFFEPSSRPVLVARLDRAFDAPALVESAVTCPRSALRPRVEGRLLLLPLAAASGDVTLSLGVLLLDGQAGRTPRRFEMPDGPPIRDEAMPRRPARPAAGERAEHGSGLAESQRPWLRLVVSNGRRSPPG